MEESKKRTDSPMASTPTRKSKRIKPEVIVTPPSQRTSTMRLSTSPRTSLSTLSEVDAEAYTEAYYDAALVALKGQRHANTYQGQDAEVIFQHLRLASRAGPEDVVTMTDAQMRELCASGKPLPIRAVVTDRGIPLGAPRSMEHMAKRVLEVYGGKETTFIPQRKSGHMTDEFHKHVRAEAFADHWLEPGKDRETWNLLEAGTHMFPHAATWIPDYATQDNLLYDFRARVVGTNRERKAPFIDKFSWWLAGDAGAYSPLHFDSHGFGTFLHCFCGELLLMFCNHVEDDAERDIIFKNIRVNGSMSDEDEAVYRKHMRYVLLQPGQMWYMDPGVLHAVYRNESTFIFGGHFIQKKRLGHWVETMSEHLRRYNGTNEDPSEVLQYLQCALELITNAKKRGVLDQWGEPEELERFFIGARQLLDNGMEWMRRGSQYDKEIGSKGRKEWTRKVEIILRVHKDLLGTNRELRG